MGYKKMKQNLGFALMKWALLFPSGISWGRLISRSPVLWNIIAALKTWRNSTNQSIGTVSKGIAVDARLVKSASRPISNEKIKEVRDKHNSPEGKLDINGNPLKFHRDLDSDWVVQKDTPHYGLKEHTSVDTNHGFVLATTMSPASVNDTNYLPYCTTFSRHTKQKIEKVYPVK